MPSGKESTFPPPTAMLSLLGLYSSFSYKRREWESSFRCISLKMCPFTNAWPRDVRCGLWLNVIIVFNLNDNLFGIYLNISSHLCLVQIIGNHDTLFPPDIFSWSQWKLSLFLYEHSLLSIKQKVLFKSHNQNRNLGERSTMDYNRPLRFSVLTFVESL